MVNPLAKRALRVIIKHRAHKPHAPHAVLENILLLPVRHLLAPVRAVALVVILPQQAPLPAALVQDALKGATTLRRVLALARPVRQGSLVTILRWRCLDPLTWPCRQNRSVP